MTNHFLIERFGPQSGFKDSAVVVDLHGALCRSETECLQFAPNLTSLYYDHAGHLRPIPGSIMVAPAIISGMDEAAKLKGKW